MPPNSLQFAIRRAPSSINRARDSLLTQTRPFSSSQWLRRDADDDGSGRGQQQSAPRPDSQDYSPASRRKAAVSELLDMGKKTAPSSNGTNDRNASTTGPTGTTTNNNNRDGPPKARVVDFSKINVSMLRSLQQQRTPTNTGTLRSLRAAPRGADGGDTRHGGSMRRGGRDSNFRGGGRTASSGGDGSNSRQMQARRGRGGRGRGGGGAGSRGSGGGRAKREDAWPPQWDEAEREWLAAQAEKKRGLTVRFDPELTASELAGWAPAVPSFVTADGSEALPLPLPSSSASKTGEGDGKSRAEEEKEKEDGPATQQRLAQRAAFVRAQNERGGAASDQKRYGQRPVVAYEPRIASHPDRFISRVLRGDKIFFQSEAERAYAERVVPRYLESGALKEAVTFGPETEALGELDELRGPILAKVLEGRYGEGPVFVETSPPAAGAPRDRKEKVLEATLATVRNYTAREPTWTRNKSSELEQKVAELIEGRHRSSEAEDKAA